MAHTKSGGSTKNGRDSVSKRLGVKRQNAEYVSAGEVLIRQRGTRYYNGLYVRRGKDDTLYAATNGTVLFSTKTHRRFDGSRRKVTVVAIQPRESEQ